MLYGGENINLIDGTLFQLWVLFELENGDDLDSKLLFGADVNGFIDLAIHALSDDFLKGIVLYYFSHITYIL
jgi:hypothetical protein